jgi:heme-degrading monooxygenase HmoA
MIARIWRGVAASTKADAYRHHFITTVAPHLEEMEGHKGAYLLRRDVEGQVEFLAVTLWDSIETITQFTGPDPAVAIVEPEGRAALSTFDDFASHYEVSFSAA